MRNVCKKIRYTTETQALGSAARTAETQRKRGDHWPIHAYFHEQCGYWHVGHAPAAVLANRPPPSQYRTSAPIKPLAAYFEDTPPPVGDIERPEAGRRYECRTCGMPLQWSKKQRCLVHQHTVTDHDTVAIEMVDRVCRACGEPVQRVRKNRLRWTHTIPAVPLHPAIPSPPP